MKIAIITNVPDKNNPMFSSFVQFAHMQENSVFTSSRFKLNDYLNPLITKHNFINLQKFKLQYIFILPAIILLLFRILFLVSDNSYINKRKIKIKHLPNDLFITVKSMMNNLAINLDHFIFLVRTKPDFVVCCCVSACNAARVYKFFYNKHFAYSIYEVYPNHNKDHSDYIVNRYHRTLEEKKACLQCAFVISPATDTFGRFLKLRYKILDLKIVSLYFTHNKDSRFSTDKTSYPVKLYYHGMLDRQRYFPEFITALHLCNTNKFHLYLRGKGPELELIKDTVSKLNMHNQVTLLPFLPPELLSLASQEYDIGLSLVAFDSPNNRFLIGFKSTDYLCAGLCQFGPDSYILGNMLKNKKLGFTYKDPTVEGFASAIMDMIQEPQKIDEYKSNARILASGDASFAYCQKKFLNNINHFIKP
jgi:hypothetical protein